MKTFVAALLILAALIGATIANAWITGDAVEEVEKAVRLIGGNATETNAKRIAVGIKTVEDNRSVLHLSIRHTHIDQLAVLLEEAYAYCLAGDAPSMNASVAAALYKIERWKEMESYTLYNIL